MKPVYEKIKELRLKKGMSQQELAQRSGYRDRSAIHHIENGERNITQSRLERIAQALGVTAAQLLEDEKPQAVKIPVLGRVAAGIPVEAVQEVLEYEEITPELSGQGEFFALRVRGDSMEPKFSEGDIVIVKKQSDVESGEIAIVLVNDSDATIKKLQKFDGGINLIPSNPVYDILTFTDSQIKTLPVSVIGKVVELRAKF